MSRSKPLTPSQERARQTFRALRRLRGLTHQDIANLTGVSRGYVESKSCGASAIDLKDVELLASALSVSETVFLMEPHEAQRWALDNPSDVVVPLSPCMREPAARRLPISPLVVTLPSAA